MELEDFYAYVESSPQYSQLRYKGFLVNLRSCTYADGILYFYCRKEFRKEDCGLPTEAGMKVREMNAKRNIRKVEFIILSKK